MRAAFPGDGGAGPRRLQPLLGGAVPPPADPRGRIEWLRRQGPRAPSLVARWRSDAPRLHAVVFFTYLYYPTYGAGGERRRRAQRPRPHDARRAPLQFGIYDEVFARPRALGFLTPAEEALVRRRFDLGDRPTAVAGMGVEIPPAPDVVAFRRRFEVTRPFALYAGRIDAGKGCAEMIAHYARYRSAGGAADLLLIGTLAMDLPPVPGLRHLGYLSEADKNAALAAAAVVVCPSAYESLSIALLEGFAVDTPGLVNGARRC